MSKSELLVLIFLITASTVKAYADINNIVLRCQELVDRFQSKEDSYTRKTPIDERKPDFAGPQIDELQETVYVKQKAQRPFECITDRVPRYLYRNLKQSSAYRNLVSKCKKASPKPRCDIESYKYRKIDGTCNNLKNPRWGSSFCRLRRLLPANYNGTSGLRQSKCQKPLPDPRSLRLHISTDENINSHEITQMFPFFGQALAHDLTDVPITFVGNKTLNCCPKRSKAIHPQCSPILFEKDDPFYSKYNITCMSFVRAAMFDSCDVGKREHMNQDTAYIDLSFVYGLTDHIAKELRAKDGTGKLLVQYENNEPLLPIVPNTPECDKDGKYNCFLTGDRRGNMHTCLMAFHTIFLREHNRLAEELRNTYLWWTEEKLYQEARKINIAQFQAIVYKEFLPVLLGKEIMNRRSLWISPNKNTVYNPFIDPSLFTEFNTAAYRLHTLLNGMLTTKGENGLKRINDIYRNVEPLYLSETSSLMHDLCQSPSQKYDKYISVDVTDSLYRSFEYEWGFDIAAANILRGRDVGLSSYTDIVRYISKNKTNIQEFEDLRILIDEENIKGLKEVYCNVEDIDMWVGMINERVPGSMVIGPTAAEIIGLQFENLKYGDRFYFEHLIQFSFGQLQSLRGVTLSSILCLNTEIESIQVNAFRPPDSITNPDMDCNDIPKLDLNHWLIDVV